MDLFYDGLIVGASELIKGRFFFICLREGERPKSTGCTHYFSIDEELCYEGFFHDFGPLNIAMLYHYCVKVNKKLNYSMLQKKKIVHYTSLGEQKRVNAAYLVCAYMIINYDFTSNHVFEILTLNNSPFVDFRDASMGTTYTISLKNCLDAIYKAHCLGMFHFDDFDFLEYEHYERVENGDLNWIVPGKLIGFCGPQNRALIDNGYPLHSPETYFSYFRRHDITTIVRLNKSLYDASKFTKAGFKHTDLYFADGSTPSEKILANFLSICEETDGAVAVHCKAGLGRTGSLIGSYIMKHYKFTAEETIAWVRICRPGSVIGHQQAWLQSKQSMLWDAGDRYRAKLNISGPVKHLKGIYSYSHAYEVSKKLVTKNGDVSGILKKVDTMQLEDEDSVEEDFPPEPLTQGDQLNRIKSQRCSHYPGNERKFFHTRILVSPLESTSMLRGGKVLARGVKTSNTSTRLAIKSARTALTR